MTCLLICVVVFTLPALMVLALMRWGGGDPFEEYDDWEEMAMRQRIEEGERLLRTMRRHRLSSVDLARLTGIPASRICKWLTGHAEISAESRARISYALAMRTLERRGLISESKNPMFPTLPIAGGMDGQERKNV